MIKYDLINFLYYLKYLILKLYKVFYTFLDCILNTLYIIQLILLNDKLIILILSILIVYFL